MVLAKLYLPKDAENYEEARDHAVRWLTEDFGGATLYDARGAWERDNGDVIQEDTTVIESVSNDRRSHVYDRVTAIANGVFNLTEEDAVMAVVDGEQVLITE